MKEHDSAWTEYTDMKRYGPASRHTRRLVHHALTPLAPSSVLDVGCGDGYLLKEISQRQPSVQRLLGIDISEVAVEKAAERVDGDFRVWDITEGPPPVKPVDVAVCSEVLEHVTDDVQALRNIAAVTRRHIVVTVPAGAMTEDQQRAGHLRQYSPKTITEACRRADLQVEYLHTWGFPFYNLYRRAIGGMSGGYRTGEYSPLKRLICHALYALFFVNIPIWGERIVLRATAKRSE